ncbi:MAG: TM2 domain-containing protein [Acidobacteria bacterium]|jgi:ribosomal protein L40E|nr:TM2 domain-containing protein [Acidobacteriota bacterium]
MEKRMFCRHCGKELSAQAVVCISCGCAPATGDRFCQHCGAETQPAAAICLKCGVSLIGRPRAGAKSKVAAGVLGILLGGLGVHRFYLGFVGIGILQIIVTLITCGLGAIWGFVEGILILTGSMNQDARGNLLVD